MMTFITMK